MIDASKFVVTEGVSGVYHYHLSPSAQYAYVKGLCGAPTMTTSIAVENWGFQGGEHLPKKYTYCETCERIAKEVP